MAGLNGTMYYGLEYASWIKRIPATNGGAYWLWGMAHIINNGSF